MKNNWENTIPWYMTIVSTIVLIALAIFLISNIEWFKEQALESDGWESEVYQIHIHHLHLSMIKRSVGLFSGFAALFIGMAVSFYSLKKQTQLNMETPNLSIVIATASPGIIAMVLGGFLIVSTVQSKDQFANYEPDSKEVQVPVVPDSPFKDEEEK